MSINSIRRALEARYNTLSPVWQTAQINQEFTPTPGTAYHRLSLLPNNSTNASYGSGITVMEQGIFQIDVFYPSGKGIDRALTRADLVRDHFMGTDGKPINLTDGGITIRILEKPSVRPMFVSLDQPFVQIPVDVKYIAYIPPS